MSSTLTEEIAQTMSGFIEPLTVEQYHAMIRQGILVEGAPIELIDGLMVRKDRRDKGGSIMTVGLRHANTITRLYRLLSLLIDGPGIHTRCQQPITLDGANEPDPDLSVVLGDVEAYAHHHPGPGAIVLLIEVADSSLSFDRSEKLRKYAAAGVPTYWIVNLNNDTVEVYSQPDPQARSYRRDMVRDRDCTLELETVDMKVDVAIADFMA